MRNVNKLFYYLIPLLFLSFILTMRNVNEQIEESKKAYFRFYINYEECKYIV